MVDPNGLLMIEPKNKHNTSHMSRIYIDSLVRKMTAAFRAATHNEFRRYKGHHICVCGAESDCFDHYINGVLTNSLCIHYLAYHRDEISDEELAKIEALPFGEAEPTSQELYPSF
jgi:hypothetical protein